MVAHGRSWWLVVACGGSCVVLDWTVILFPFTSLIIEQFVKGKGSLEVGTRSLAALATFRFDTRLIFMSWQPE